ncbi:MerR family transcriptional regulator [Streptosporangium sp. NBC_01756]|uniref:MerR family transcriptional regulator n=1 Tax=Streptosporangium sp. NBC_01756 TaxID=2975950 RepID=UPI002DD84106|nr:MerR family transcriptional regulator [Streptosporangium sp. NBC_01756]WSC85476.1 MerR family transcriptional regulator [Streptosporangium sp. NBC_01756]
MKIGELSRRTGVSPRLLRYYEEQGLLTSIRADSGHRSYDEDAPVVVRHIRALLSANLPTRVIREILPCVEGPGPQLNECVSEVLRERLRSMDDQIDELQEARSLLAHLLPQEFPRQRATSPGGGRRAA